MVVSSYGRGANTPLCCQALAPRTATWGREARPGSAHEPNDPNVGQRTDQTDVEATAMNGAYLGTQTLTAAAIPYYACSNTVPNRVEQ